MGSPEDTPFTDPVRHRVMRALAGFKSFVVNLFLEPELRVGILLLSAAPLDELKTMD